MKSAIGIVEGLYCCDIQVRQQTHIDKREGEGAALRPFSKATSI